MTLRCRLCNADAVQALVDFGLQPIANRFLRAPDEAQALFPLVLAQCPACGLAQLKDAIGAKDLKPRFDWITYREPEAHLDDLADAIANLARSERDRPIWGVSFKDDSLLRRLQLRGFSHTYRLDPVHDLDLTSAAGVEQIQERLTPDRAERAAADRDRPFVLIARHIVEHAENLSAFLQALRRLLAPGGYLVLEVPDCGPAFSRSDCTALWEEHVLYFTAPCLLNVFDQLGLIPVYQYSYPYDGENVLLAIGRDAGSAHDTAQVNAEDRESLEAQRQLLKQFVHGLAARRERLVSAIRQHRPGSVALFGAGHLGCTFINLVGLQNDISLVIDENPHKQGLYLPGARLPIVGPQALWKHDFTLCLLAVQHAAARTVLQRHAAWAKRGGRFASVFAGNPLSLCP
jgi:hypothetical protein